MREVYTYDDQERLHGRIVRHVEYAIDIINYKHGKRHGHAYDETITGNLGDKGHYKEDIHIGFHIINEFWI